MRAASILALVAVTVALVVAVWTTASGPALPPLPTETAVVVARVETRVVFVPVTVTPSPYPTHQPWIQTRTAEARIATHPAFPTLVPSPTATACGT